MGKKINMPYVEWDKILPSDSLASVSTAFKSLEKGTASEPQQKLILDFMIRIGCRTYDTDWFSEERVSCFAAGRRYVGQQICRMLNYKVGKLKS